MFCRLYLKGWRGATCEDNVDECASESPCLNGGMCMDTPGSYLCSCQFGFTGDWCQLELEKCDSNPCQNDALCFVPVEDSEQTHHCYCVPDYHGPHCEFKYNDCFLPPFPKYVYITRASTKSSTKTHCKSGFIFVRTIFVQNGKCSPFLKLTPML